MSNVQEESSPLLEGFDHSNYAIYIVVINIGERRRGFF